MEENKIFVPHELKTIEIDVEKKIFRVNGEDFGKRCTGFSIWCDSSKDSGKNWFDVDMDINASLRYIASYDINGKKTSEKAVEKAGK